MVTNALALGYICYVYLSTWTDAQYGSNSASHMYMYGEWRMGTRPQRGRVYWWNGNNWCYVH